VAHACVQRRHSYDAVLYSVSDRGNERGTLSPVSAYKLTLPVRSLRSRLTGGLAWTLVGSASQQASLLAAAILIARVAGKTQFGEYVLLQGTLGTFAVLAGIAFGMTAARHVAAFRDIDKTRTASLCKSLMVSTGIISFALACGLALLAVPLANHILGDASLAASIQFGSLYVLFQSYQGVQSGILAGLEAFSANARINALRSALLIVCVLALTPRFGAAGGIMALVISAVGACVHSHWLLRREFDKRGIPTAASLARSDLRIVWRFSVPAFLSGAMVPPALWIASVTLARQPNGYAELAIFGAANQWRAAIAFLPAVLAQPLLPLLTSALTAGNRVAFRRLVLLGVAINTTSAILIAILVIAFAPFLVASYGKDFSKSAPLLTVLGIATVINAAAGTVGYALASLDEMWAGFALNSIWASSFLGIIYAHRFSLDANTVARAFLLSYLLHAVTTTVYLLYRTHGIPRLRHVVAR
jgi:O-antigen/teichoic acid export membrane protein